MLDLLIFLSVLVFLAIGVCAGYYIGNRKKLDLYRFEKEEIYCAGWEDGLYYAMNEYRPELFIREKALDGFKEYECKKWVEIKNKYH